MALLPITVKIPFSLHSTMYPLIKLVRNKIIRKETAIILISSLIFVACGPAEDDPSTTGGDTAGSTGGSTDAGTTAGSETAGSTDAITPPELSPLPIVRVPADIQTSVSNEVAIVGSAIFPGIPLDVPVIDWSVVSGPGTVSFSKSGSLATSATFDAVGDYVLELSVSNGPYTSSDQLAVVVINDQQNVAPTVDAGPDEIVNIDTVLNVAAIVEDDGLPDNTLFGAWSKVSGPGIATFGEVIEPSTTVTFSDEGDYALRYTASDGDLSAGDDLNVTVNEPTNTGNNNQASADNEWEYVVTDNGTEPQARHEAGGVEYDGKFYLLGGRGNRQVNRYNPATNSWENLGTPALELNHFQPVVYDDKIYVIGALDCCYPSENVVSHIQIFDPETLEWSEGPEIPLNRRRGSAGTVVHQNRIYMIGGNINGHDGGMVNWFDEYNPATNTWKTLTPAPTQRDHFSAVVVGNKLVLAGGRKTDWPQTFQNLVPEVDVYNFSTGNWENAPDIPTKRAGALVVPYGNEAIVIGGEISTGSFALTVVEAYNVQTKTWRLLKPLNLTRHSGGVAILGDEIHVVSGNTKIGGGSETPTHEKLKLQ